MRPGLAAGARPRLAPGGLPALPLELQYPAAGASRGAWRTPGAALERAGAAQPARHVAVLRGLQALVVLASPEPLAAGDLARMARLRRALVVRPRVAALGSSAPRPTADHRLESPAFFELARAVLVGARCRPMRGASSPRAGDDGAAGISWHSRRWAEVPALVERLGPRALAYLDWTLLLAALTTAIVSVLAFVLILLPLGRSAG
ncbi:MAG: hypothetical protein U5K43_12080 [Halofilum sp. (in: g-proteobacteria)]|nr:hypothetical protein [Halofilum sp. (in: g-proteobacteria)]